MSSDFFASIMEDLYTLAGKEIPEEIKAAVYFTLKSDLRIGFQMAENSQGILMVSELGPLPRSASRTLWVQEALRWNGDIEGCGQLFFNPSQEMLGISHVFPLVLLNAELIYDTIPAFEERALIWKNAIDSGYPPTLPGAISLKTEEFNPFRAGSAPGRFIGTLRP